MEQEVPGSTAEEALQLLQHWFDANEADSVEVSAPRGALIARAKWHNWNTSFCVLGYSRCVVNAQDERVRIHLKFVPRNLLLSLGSLQFVFFFWTAFHPENSLGQIAFTGFFHLAVFAGISGMVYLQVRFGVRRYFKVVKDHAEL